MRHWLALIVSSWISVVGSAQACPAPTTWIAMPTANGPTGESSQVRWLDGRLWMFGDVIAGWEPCTNTWKRLPNTNRPQGFNLEYSRIESVSGKLVIVPPSENGKTSIAVVDDRGWRLIDTKIAITRFYAFASTGKYAVIWGGLRTKRRPDGSEVDELSGSGVRIDPVAGTATPMSTKGAPSARANPQVAWTGTQMFVWGGVTKPSGFNEGCSASGGCTLATDGALYDPAADTWTPIATAGAPSKRLGANVAWNGSQVIVFGGWSDGVISRDSTQLFDGARYDPARGTWQAIADASRMFRGRTHTSLFVTGSHAVALTGIEGAVYELARGAWTPLPPKPNPSRQPWAIAEAPWFGYVVPEDGIVTRFDVATLSWQIAKLPTKPEPGQFAWAGDRFVAWHWRITVADPNGDNGCRGVRRPCDPINPTKQLTKPGGAAIGVQWTKP